MNRFTPSNQPEWDLVDNRIILSTPNFTIKLYPVWSGDTITKAPPELAPSRFCLIEWIDYRLRVEPQTPLQVLLGSSSLEPDPDGYFLIRYENYLGQSRIRVKLTPHQTVTLPVEVLSSKYRDPDQYRAFYQTLLTTLHRQAVQLPFAINAPAQVAVAEVAAPPSPLFVYHFFRHYDRALRLAVEMILAEPHRQLADEPQWLPLPQATDLNPEVILAMLTHPEYLVKTNSEAIPFAARLRQKAPSHVWQRLSRETFDTPENRFVQACLGEFQHWLETLPTMPWWPMAPPATQIELRDLTGYLGQVQRDPLFDEVSQMVVFPASSQVLLRRNGYRELLQLWRLFHLARRPLFADLAAAIELRDVATLYEYWCFFELIEQFSLISGKAPTCSLTVTDTEGLRYEALAEWPQFGKLVYNLTFGRPKGSYSVSLRPDFVFYPTGATRPIIFDAKFRFVYADWDNEDNETPERLAKRADLYKMHTYRDALKAQAAVVLYPGDSSVFYSLIGDKKVDIALKDIMSVEGVGAIRLEPGKDYQND